MTAEDAAHSYRHGRITIRTDFEAAALSAALAESVEAFVPRLEAATGGTLGEETPLRFRLLTDEPDYFAHFYRRSGEVKAPPTAFTDNQTLESFLCVPPRFEPALLEEFGVPDRMLHSVLHETVHQFTAHTDCLPHQAVPIWITEGLCEHLAAEQVRERCSEAQPIPLYVLGGRNRVARALRAGSALPLDQLFGETAWTRYEMVDPEPFYNQSHSLVAFLLDPESGVWHERFTAFLTELRARPRLRYRSAYFRESSRIAALWRTRLQDQAAFELAWTEWATRSVGDWSELWPSAQWTEDELITASDRWDILSLAQFECAHGETLALEFEMQILAVGDRRAHIVLYMQDEPLEYVALTIPAHDAPYASLLRRNKWRTLAFGGLVPHVGTKPTRVRVEVDGRAIRLFLDGERAFAAKVDPLVVQRGQSWGLGAEGSAVRYKDIRVEDDE